MAHIQCSVSAEGWAGKTRLTSGRRRRTTTAFLQPESQKSKYFALKTISFHKEISASELFSFPFYCFFFIISSRADLAQLISIVRVENQLCPEMPGGPRCDIPAA